MRLGRAVTTLLVMGLCAVGTAASAEGLVLVENGEPAARIVAGKDVSPTARFGAKELQA